MSRSCVDVTSWSCNLLARAGLYRIVPTRHLALMRKNIITKSPIKPTLISKWPAGFMKSRKEEVVLSRLRIGHTYF